MCCYGKDNWVAERTRAYSRNQGMRAIFHKKGKKCLKRAKKGKCAKFENILKKGR